MWAHQSITKWVSCLCSARKCFVILGINYQCFTVKNSHAFLKGKTEGILTMTCSSWVTEFILRKGLGTDTQKNYWRKWNDLKIIFLTLKCELKKKNAGVKVSSQYYAPNASWLGNYFLSFCLFFCKEMDEEVFSLLVSAWILYILSEGFLFSVLFGWNE